MLDLPTIWFLLIGVLIGGYAVLDGFDLGAGILHLWVARGDDERRTVIAAIGPVWDGNEVWLLTAGGALFAAFPVVYATVFSGFYLALMLLLVALIFRAVAIEFRDQEASPRWRTAWDVAFAAGSLVAALLLGVAIGNIVAGLPLDADGQYRGGLLGLLRPFPLAVGLLTVALFSWHGAGWLVLKTGGDVQDARPTGALRRARCRASTLARGDRARAGRCTGGMGPVRSASRLAGACSVPRRPRSSTGVCRAMDATRRRWWPPAQRSSRCWPSSGISLYPDLVPSTGAGASITVAGAASSDLTLTVMLIIALLGMPLVLLYTGYVYSRFAGRAHVQGGYGH